MECIVNNPHTNAEKYFSSTVVKLQTDAPILAAMSRLKCHPQPQSMNLSVPPKMKVGFMRVCHDKGISICLKITSDT